jgi:hypothetical protein
VSCYLCNIPIFYDEGILLFRSTPNPGGSHTVGCPLLIIKYIQTPLYAGKGFIPAGENPFETDSEIESVICVWLCSMHWAGEKHT